MNKVKYSLDNNIEAFILKRIKDGDKEAIKLLTEDVMKGKVMLDVIKSKEMKYGKKTKLVDSITRLSWQEWCKYNEWDNEWKETTGVIESIFSELRRANKNYENKTALGEAVRQLKKIFEESIELNNLNGLVELLRLKGESKEDLSSFNNIRDIFKSAIISKDYDWITPESWIDFSEKIIAIDTKSKESVSKINAKKVDNGTGIVLGPIIINLYINGVEENTISWAKENIGISRDGYDWGEVIKPMFDIDYLKFKFDKIKFCNITDMVKNLDEINKYKFYLNVKEQAWSAISRVLLCKDSGLAISKNINGLVDMINFFEENKINIKCDSEFEYANMSYALMDSAKDVVKCKLHGWPKNVGSGDLYLKVWTRLAEKVVAIIDKDLLVKTLSEKMTSNEFGAFRPEVEKIFLSLLNEKTLQKTEKKYSL